MQANQIYYRQYLVYYTLYSLHWSGNKCHPPTIFSCHQPANGIITFAPIRLVLYNREGTAKTGEEEKNEEIHLHALYVNATFGNGPASWGSGAKDCVLNNGF